MLLIHENTTDGWRLSLENVYQIRHVKWKTMGRPGIEEQGIMMS